jgi:hypothetical protein
MAVRTLANGNPPRYAGAASPRKRRNTCPTTQRRFGMCGFWRAPADPGCPLSRRVLEGKRTCHGDRESDVHDPGRVKTRVFAVNTRILEKCILQLDAVSASSAAVSDSLRKHFRFGCSANEFHSGSAPPASIQINSGSSQGLRLSVPAQSNPSRRRIRQAAFEPGGADHVCQ